MIFAREFILNQLEPFIWNEKIEPAAALLMCDATGSEPFIKEKKEGRKKNLNEWLTLPSF